MYYTCKIKNPLKCIYLSNCIAWVRENKEVHGLCLVLIVLATIVINVSNQIGVSALGSLLYIIRSLWVEGSQKFNIPIISHVPHVHHSINNYISIFPKIFKSDRQVRYQG